jgi:hypothetical protein
MRRYAVALLAVFIATTLYFGMASKTRAQSSANSGRTPVFLELFTSEGCSSCPSADALLQKLLRQQPVEGAEIIALEEHVDYWNSLGWSDPFSSSSWTERQQDYAAKFGNDAYTPELVIDGRVNFVGSNGREAENEIAQAARSPKAKVEITSGAASAVNSQSFSISVGKLTPDQASDAEVWLAVAEDGLHSTVNAGENSGRLLNHVATLRSLRQIGVADRNASAQSFAGTYEVKFKPGWKTQNIRVVTFVQEKRSRQILGVASIALHN